MELQYAQADAPRCTATTGQRQWHGMDNRIGCDRTHRAEYKHHPYPRQEIISKKILKDMFSVISGVIYNPGASRNTGSESLS